LNAPDRPAPFNTPSDGTASVNLKVTCLLPGTTTESGESPPCSQAGDQADVKVTSAVSDVRCAAVGGGCAVTGGTYAGKVLGIVGLRITDRLNGSGQAQSGTATDYPFMWGTQCVVGACAMTTSADAVLPDLVREQKRAIWQLGEIQVFDGGADGDLAAAAGGSCPPACVANGGEELFLRQGLFVP
jgi:hypothetical protein